MAIPYEIRKNWSGKHSVHYACPKCGERLKSPLVDAGRPDECPNCHVRFVVPGEISRKQIEEAQLTEKLEREAAAVRRKEARRERKAERRREKAERYWENERRKLKQQREQERGKTTTQREGRQHQGRQSPPDNVAKQPTPLQQSLDFVREKFFKLAHIRTENVEGGYIQYAASRKFIEFRRYYASKYGDGAEAYLSRTCEAWRSGWTGMSGQTQRRILECVPPFLEIDEQFELLAFFVPPAINQQFNEQCVALSEMAECYHRIAKSVNCKEYDLPWFVREVFSAEEIAEFLNVFRFTMIDGLRRSYHDVRDDLVALQAACSATDAAVSVDYRIALLNCPLDIDTLATRLPPTLEISTPEPRLVTEFRQQYRQILLEHVVNARAAMREGDIRHRMAIGDVNSVIRQLNRTKSDQEYESTLTIEGRGGDFTVCFEKKNLLRLRSAIAVECAKLAAAIIGTVSSALALLFFFASDALPWILYLLGALAFSIVSGIWTKLESLSAEVKEYERKRRTGVAPPRH